MFKRAAAVTQYEAPCKNLLAEIGSCGKSSILPSAAATDASAMWKFAGDYVGRKATEDPLRQIRSCAIKRQLRYDRITVCPDFSQLAVLTTGLI
jgi:hypothetical protein